VGTGNTGCQASSIYRNFLCLILSLNVRSVTNNPTLGYDLGIFIPDDGNLFQFDVTQFRIKINKNKLFLLQSKNVYTLNHSGTAAALEFQRYHSPNELKNA